MQLRPLRDIIIVDPYYDAEVVGSGHDTEKPRIFLPDSAKNPMSQQGRVVAVGPRQRVLKPEDYILYHPFTGLPFYWEGQEYLKIEYHFVVGWLKVENDQPHIYPLPGEVLIEPAFNPREAAHGIILIEAEPPRKGRVVRVGDGVTSVQPGDRVVFPLSHEGHHLLGQPAGSEIGLVNRVWYTIPERFIFATEKECPETST